MNVKHIPASLAFSLMLILGPTAPAQVANQTPPNKDEAKKAVEKKNAEKKAATEAKSAPASDTKSEIVETVFDYKMADGVALKAYVYKPPGDEVRPALIVLH